MKKQYIRPTMRVVKIQQRHIICASPDGYNGQNIKMRGGSQDTQIDNEQNVW